MSKLKLALFHKVHLIKKSTRPLCLLPTGLFETIIMSHICRFTLPTRPLVSIGKHRYV